MVLTWGTHLTAGYFRAFTTNERTLTMTHAETVAALKRYPFALSWYQEVDGEDEGVYTLNSFHHDGDHWDHREIARNWMLA